MEAENEDQRRVLVRLLAINAVMFVVEMVVGVCADSSGVIADSLDMLADAMVYGLGLYAVGRSAALKRRAARWSGLFQVGLAVCILLDAIRRGWWGSEPTSVLMMAVSLVALAANAYCLFLLQKHRDGEVHMRASWIFSRSDVIANVGVMVAGALVAGLGSRWPDLVVGAAIAGVVVYGGLAILADTRRDAEAGEKRGCEGGGCSGRECERHEAERRD
ncbi:cation transporter [Opitutus sp. ER46]|uniref:cation transporter n=1 Tax=Opitutus sp. ER46 TaxID=2161864 RepID=UPI001E5A8477|nr:cation transporter [Opitutus sp. ER46]